MARISEKYELPDRLRTWFYPLSVGGQTLWRKAQETLKKPPPPSPRGANLNSE